VKIIGLTGGIASGKSTAARYLGECGAHVIDADILGHRAYDPGTDAFRQVVATFGDDVVGDDGNIDRRALGGKVFGKPDQLTALTDIVWPEIRRLAAVATEEIRARDSDAIVILEAAVLFEAGWEEGMDETWVITVEVDVAVQRAMARDNHDEEAVRKRIAAQLSNNERVARASVAIDNSADEATLQRLLALEWARISGD
jgi:dephospho-CoA kinase